MRISWALWVPWCLRERVSMIRAEQFVFTARRFGVRDTKGQSHWSYDVFKRHTGLSFLGENSGGYGVTHFRFRVWMISIVLGSCNGYQEPRYVTAY